MPSTKAFMGAFAGALFSISACSPLTPAPGLVPQGADDPITEHVLVISIDGLRPDAISEFGATNLLEMAAAGAYSWRAQTTLPSKTLPSHASMLTGVSPDVHGITWNSLKSEHGVISTPTIFTLAQQAGLSTSAFFSKPKFVHLVQDGSLDHVQAPRGRKLMATETVHAAVEHLRFNSPNLMFVHIAEPDYAGHTFGWMGRVYGWAVGRADVAVAKLLRQADRSLGAGNYTVIVTSDHGGHGRDHGSDDLRDTTIPWIVWGRGVLPGQINGPVHTYDTAATALWLLGVAPAGGTMGHPVAGAFTNASVRMAYSGRDSGA